MSYEATYSAMVGVQFFFLVWSGRSSKVFLKVVIVSNYECLLLVNLATLSCTDSICFIRYVWYGLRISDTYSK